MILTVTLNVAIDKRYVVSSLEAGGVTRVKECSYTAGGKGLNVSRVAAISGEKITATGMIGGYAGEYIVNEIKKDNVTPEFVKADGESRSCVNIYDESTGIQTEILEPGLTATEKDIDAFFEKYESLVNVADVITVSGSVPQGVKKDVYIKVVEIAKNAGKPVLLDTSGELLVNGVRACPTLIKPNETEIRSLLEDGMSVREAADKLHASGIKYVAVSQGADGVLVVCDEGTFIGKPPKINAVNTVGCGDSMLAGFAVGFSRHYPIEETIRFAVAVSCANALHAQTGYYEPDDLKELNDRITVTRL